MREFLQTDRLLLRRPKLSDASTLAKNFNNPDIARMTGTMPYPYFTRAADFWIYNKTAQWQAKQSFAYVITNQQEFMGVIDIFTNGHGDRELGYWIGEPYWGHGYITEAANAILSEGFKSLGVDYIDAGYFTDNPASGRVLGKLGFMSRNFESNIYCVARGCRFPGIELRLMRDAFV
ncbi:MAG: GNAT family N-acetyltransferase [Robiginitomaculum sp.]